MKPRALVLFAAAIGGLALWSSSFQVSTNEYAIVARFGDPQEVVEEAGLHFKLPAPIDTVYRVDGRLHVLDPEPTERLTADKKNVVVDAWVAWSVADPLQFLVSVGNRRGAEARLTDVMHAVVGDVLSQYEFDSLVSVDSPTDGLAELGRALTEESARRCREEFGVEVQALHIRRLAYPDQNKQAVFNRMQAERAATANTIRAEGAEERDRIRAEADRQRRELLATAEQEAEAIRGAAKAEANRIYAEAIARDPELYDFLRRLEVLELGLGDDTELVLPADHPLLSGFDDPVDLPPSAGEGGTGSAADGGGE